MRAAWNDIGVPGKRGAQYGLQTVGSCFCRRSDKVPGLFEKPHVPHVSLRLVSKAMRGRVKPSDVRTCRDMSSNFLLPLRSVSLAGDQCEKTSK